jgi:cytochrome c oxidase subunit II
VVEPIVTVPASIVVLAATPAPGGAEHPSALDPRGPDAQTIAHTWWFLFWTALAVLVVMLAFIGWAALRGRRAAHPPDGSEGPAGEATPLGLSAHRFITIGGVVVPAIILSVVGVVTIVSTRDLQAAPQQPIHIEVTGADWFWRVSYPDSGVVTANELVVPVGVPVDVGLESTDVIHSFWVPQLTGKTDLIPGNHNTTHFTAAVAGTFRGQCAEFCGLQHANMAFFVRAVPEADYLAWIRVRRAAPAPPTDGDLLRGQQAFETLPCAGCHTVAGTSARGVVGPDLTDVGSRPTLGAGVIANTPDNVRRWITDSQSIKPGNHMPPIQLPSDELDELVAYLESLNP